MEKLPLHDVTVLDLSRNVGGQFCAKSLSWLGARVILVEEPGGAATRREGPYYHDVQDTEHSLLFAYLNTNKQSITLDIHKGEGARVLKDLVQKADVLLEDHAPGELAHLGLEYAVLERLNPRLIMVSMTPFGQTGPCRNWKATDLTVLAMGGMSTMIGQKGREPLALAGSQAHYNASVHAFAGVLTALWSRDTTGEGQYIDLSLQEAMTFSEWKGYVYYTADGEVRSRATEASSTRYVLPCKDGYVGFGVGQAEYLGPLFKLTGLEQFKDPKYAAGRGLTKHAAEVKALLAEWLKDKKQEDVYHASQRLGLPFCYIPNMADLAESPQYASRGFLVEVDHPVVGKALYPGAPMKYRGMEFPNRRAPLLGEHNPSVYRELLGYSESSLAGLKQRGVI